MMQSEFEKLVNRHVDAEDFKVIEYVYMYHPSISNTDGKRQIADLYKIGGMSVIKGMVDVAKQAQKLEGQIADLQSQLDGYKRILESLRDGDWDVETW